MTTETELEVAAKKKEIDRLNEAMGHLEALAKLGVHMPFFTDELMRITGIVQVHIWWKE